MTKSIGTLAMVVGVLALSSGCSDGPESSSSDTEGIGGGGGGLNPSTGGTGTDAGPFTCQAGQTDCGGTCVVLTTNPLHCGSCNNACPAGTSCVGGTCTCQAGLTSCNGACVDTTSDAAHCGACSNQCAAGLLCSLGACSATCAGTLTQCGQACVDLTVNPLHCGACNNACPGGRLCTGGLCTCETGTDCNGVCTDLASDPANCGQCGLVCTGGATCSAGTCVGGVGTGGASGVGGASGTGGAVGTGGAGGVAPGQPGVALNGTCYPLCVDTVAGSDPDNPDWGFENNGSCVVPNTTTAAGGLACVTGEPVPTIDDLGPRPGVVIDLTCYPLCQTVTVASNPTDAPDWGFEDGGSCVLPNTHTAVAQACTTTEPIPDPSELDPRPGVVVLDFDTQVRTCVPLCVDATDPAADSDGDDWDYEYGGSCVIPGSPTGMNQTCQTGEPIPAPLPVPGVVVVDGAGIPQCSPLCTLTTESAADPTPPLGDGWSYENNASCVIPGTATALTNQACTTESGPYTIDNSGRDGVVIFLKDDNACDGDFTECAGSWSCVANCDYYASPTQDGANDDGMADDWGWENNNECIIPGTITSANTACVTGTDCVGGTRESCPTPTSRPGIMVNGDPVENSCLWSECVPLCQVVTTASDPAYPDWGFEDNNSCVIPNTDTANWLPEGDVPRGCKEGETDTSSCYYQFPPRACTWPAPEVDFLAPPALDSGRVVHNTAAGGSTSPGHFQTVGAQLEDPYGQAFLIRGMNNSHGWFDTCGQYMAYGALDNISDAGANAVRLGWAFDSIDPVGPGSGEPEKDVIGTNPTLLAEILHEIVRLRMVPIVAVNDTTGQTTTDWPNRMAQIWTDTSRGYKEVLQAYESYLLVGIANEWNGENNDFYGAYNTAVQTMRSAGINNTLVITANAWGQGCNAIINNAQQLLTADPLSNLLFDIHIYTYLDYADCRTTTGVCGSADVVRNCLNDISSAQIPLLVGEFGHVHSSGDVAWDTIISTTNTNSQGYCPWLWFGDTEYAALDMNESWEGPLTSWGNNVLPLTGSRASIFQ